MSQSHCTALSLAFVTVADWQLNTPWFHVIPRVNYFFQLVSRHLIWTLLSNEQQVVEVFHGQSLPQSITHSVHRRKRSFNTIHKCSSTHTQLVTRQRLTGHSHIMPRFSGIGFLKNFVNLSCILHSPIHLAPQHLFLLYPIS